jgi:ribosomal protein S6
MKPYELTYIISSEITAEEAEAEAKSIELLIQGKEGVIIKSENPIPKILAYPIKRQGSGFFVILEFQLEPEHISELKEKIQKNSKIIRSMLIIKNPVKIQKERRTRRKPLVSSTTTPTTVGVPEEVKAEEENKEESKKEKKTSKKVELNEIEKKLDEILSE